VSLLHEIIFFIKYIKTFTEIKCLIIMYNIVSNNISINMSNNMSNNICNCMSNNMYLCYKLYIRQTNICINREK